MGILRQIAGLPSQNTQVYSNFSSGFDMATGAEYGLPPNTGVVVHNGGGYNDIVQEGTDPDKYQDEVDFQVCSIDEGDLDREYMAKAAMEILAEEVQLFEKNADVSLAFQRTIKEIVHEDLVYCDESIDGLKDWGKKAFNKIKTAVKRAADALGDKAKDIVNKAKDIAEEVVAVAKRVVTAPQRGALEVVLRTIGGQLASWFTYAFIPDNHSIIKDIPIVDAKRAKQKHLLHMISKWSTFSEDLLLKKLRNGFARKHNITPESYINRMVKSEIAGIGEPSTLAAWAAAIVALAPIIPGIVSIFKKSDGPSASDFANYLGKDKVPDPYGKDGAGSGEQGFFSTTAGKAVAGVGLFIGVYGTYKVLTK